MTVDEQIAALPEVDRELVLALVDLELVCDYHQHLALGGVESAHVHAVPNHPRPCRTTRRVLLALPPPPLYQILRSGVRRDARVAKSEAFTK